MPDTELREAAAVVRDIPILHGIRVSALVGHRPEYLEHLEDRGFHTSCHVSDDARRAGRLLAQHHPDFPGTLGQLADQVVSRQSPR